MSEQPKAETFTAAMVLAGITNEILPEGLPPEDLEDKVMHSRHHRARKLAEFLMPHFYRENKGEGGKITQDLRITVLMPIEQVPKGLAHTKIIFQEIE